MFEITLGNWPPVARLLQDEGDEQNTPPLKNRNDLPSTWDKGEDPGSVIK